MAERDRSRKKQDSQFTFHPDISRTAQKMQQNNFNGTYTLNRSVSQCSDFQNPPSARFKTLYKDHEQRQERDKMRKFERETKQKQKHDTECPFKP